MPTLLLPVVSKTIKVCPDTAGTQDHGQAEGHETGSHDECSGSIAGANAVHGQKSYYNPPVNIRDERTVGEQVKSGFRLAGWLLLTLAFIYALLLFAGFLVGKGDYNQPIYRVAGACGLVALSVVIFMTVRHWVGWFIGALGYFVLKTAFALLLGSSLVRPR